MFDGREHIRQRRERQLAPPQLPNPIAYLVRPRSAATSVLCFHFKLKNS